VSTDNNTRNLALRKVTAALFVLERLRPAKFPLKNPLNLKMHYPKCKNLLSQLAPPKGGDGVSLMPGPAKTAANAYAYHYYVLSS
jgi:hypothetical protein